MKGNIRGNSIVIDGKIIPDSGFVELPVENVLYEVIRVIESRLLFPHDHLNRLKSSCRANDITCSDTRHILSGIRMLIRHAKIHSGNIKVLVFKQHSATRWACFFIPHKYPEPGDYKNGVRLKTFPYERPDPNIKKWNDQFRKKVNAFIADNNIYEAGLLNSKGYITEGSRSNIFFLDRNGALITSPTEVVLPGITRTYILKICNQLDLPVSEKIIHHRDLQQMSGCFLTGTSPKVLPVSKIDDISFSPSHEKIQIIMKEFDRLIERQK